MRLIFKITQPMQRTYSFWNQLENNHAWLLFHGSGSDLVQFGLTTPTFQKLTTLGFLHVWAVKSQHEPINPTKSSTFNPYFIPFNHTNCAKQETNQTHAFHFQWNYYSKLLTMALLKYSRMISNIILEYFNRLVLALMRNRL